MALNVGVWLANLADGMTLTRPDVDDLFRWGGNSASAVVHDGELWRLLSATVLHAGLMHLALNLYALWMAGEQVARWFGHGRFLLIYWGSALLGSALSLHFAAQQSVSVGASGAVFGVLGALLVGVWQRRERVPADLRVHLLISQGLFVVIALAMGFVSDGIDHAAHIGGLLAGAVMAWLMLDRAGVRAGERLRRRPVLAVGLVGLVVAGLVWTAPAGVDHRALLEAQAAWQQMQPRLHAAERALQADALAQKQGRLSHAQLVQAMERTHIPAYRALVEELARLREATPSPQLDDLHHLQAGVLELMTLEVGMAQGRLDPVQAEARAQELSAQLARLSQRMRERSAAQ